jgi:hypothetical protein
MKRETSSSFQQKFCPNAKGEERKEKKEQNLEMKKKNRNVVTENSSPIVDWGQIAAGLRHATTYIGPL